MQKDKELSQAEELSKCIDALNQGKQPTVQDEEIEELAALAVRVKQAYRKETIPDSLIAEMSDTLATELKKQNSTYKRRWLYGGFAGAAAAIITVFAQFLLPGSPEQQIAEPIYQSVEAPQIAAANIEAEHKESGQLQIDRKEEPSSITDKEQTPISASSILTEIIKGEMPKTEEKSTQVALLKQETPQEPALAKSRFMTRTRDISAEENNSPSKQKFTIMAMADQKAQSMTIDKEQGIVQQVYMLKNNEKITITQRIIEGNQEPSSNTNKEQTIAPNSSQRSFVKNDNTNSVIIKVDKYDLIIEGEKSSAELKKIAQSLVVKEIEE